MLIQGPQYCVLVHCRRDLGCHPPTNAVASQKIASQRFLSPHREWHIIGKVYRIPPPKNLKQRTEGPNPWEKGIQLSADTIKA